MYLSNEEILRQTDEYAERNDLRPINGYPILRSSSEYGRMRPTQYNKTDNPVEYKENQRASREAKVVASVKREEATAQNVLAGLPIELQNALLRR